MIRTWATALVVLVGVSFGVGEAQTPAAVRLVSPRAGEIVSGTVTIRADLSPDLLARAQSVTISVDGAALCSNLPPGTPECTWNAGRDVAQHLIRVVVNVASGERAVATVRTGKLDYVDVARVDVVQVAATVRDRQGHFVSGLTPQAFRILEDGKPREISHFSAEDSALSLVVAVDVSASMNEAMPEVKEAVSTFLRAVSPRDRVTLIAFNDSLFTLANAETDPDARVKAVDRLSAFGSTALYDALSKSIDMLGEAAGRRAIVLFTDGEDRSSQTSLASVREKLETTDATLFVVGLGRGAVVEQLKETLSALVESNGGLVQFAERARDLKTPFTAVLEELSHQYLLGFTPPGLARDGAWHPLRIEVSNRDLRIRARQGYRAPAK